MPSRLNPTAAMTTGERLQQLAEGAEQQHVAMRKKDRGIWHEITWATYYREVLAVAGGFLSLGLAKGDVVVILGDNSPEMVYAQLAVQVLGALPLHINFLIPAWEIVGIIQLCGAKLAVASSQECVDKLLTHRAELSTLHQVVYIKNRGAGAYLGDDWLLAYDTLRLAAPTTAVTDAAANVSPDDTCLLTVGERGSGGYKLAMFTHTQLLGSAYDLARREGFLPSFDYFSLASLANVFEQLMAVYVPMACGMCCHFPETTETAFLDLQEVAPHVITGTPEVWQSLWARVQVGVTKSYKLLQAVYAIFLHYLIAEVVEFKIRGIRLPLYHRLRYGALRHLLFRPLRRSIGLRRVQKAYCYGHLGSFDLFASFQILGVSLRMTLTYNELATPAFLPPAAAKSPADFSRAVSAKDARAHFLTQYFVDHAYLLASHFAYENCPNILRHSTPAQRRRPHLLTVGTHGPEVSVRLAADATLELSSPYLCKGFYKAGGESKLRDDGSWHNTSDVAFLMEGQHLVVLDRKSHIIADTNGKYFCATHLETLLLTSPFLAAAYLHIDSHGYHNALVAFNPTTVRTWLNERGYQYSSYNQMTQHQRLIRLLRRQIRAVNARITPLTLHIQRFAIAPEIFYTDTGEVTPSGRTRRAVVEEAYKDVLKVFDALPAPPHATGDVILDVLVHHRTGPGTASKSHPVTFVSLQGKEH